MESRDAFGIIVSYAVKVKLFLGALGGELCAELPFILMHPKVSLLSTHKIHVIHISCTFQPQRKSETEDEKPAKEVDV